MNRAYQQNTARDMGSELSREELIDAVATLRSDVSSMSNDIRAILAENEALKREVNRLENTEAPASTPVSEARRVKAEIDQLVAMHGAMSSRRPAPRREERGGSNSAWMKKMMMFMMMAEMV